MKAEWIRAERDLDETYWWFVGRRAILERVLQRFGKHSRVAVDIGSGSGRNMPVLARFADHVIGLDRSSAALELAASHGRQTVRADGQAIPLADSSVDLLSALDVLEHLDDDLGALDEFHRVLRPEGYLLVSVPAYRFLWSEHDEALRHRRRYVASELHIKLTRAGFRVLKRSYAVFFAFFPIVFYRLFRGLVPKDPLAPKASYVMLPAVLNRLLIALLRFEAWMMGALSLPWGTSLVVLAQKGWATTVAAEVEPARLGEDIHSRRRTAPTKGDVRARRPAVREATRFVEQPESRERLAAFVNNLRAKWPRRACAFVETFRRNGSWVGGPTGQNLKRLGRFLAHREPSRA